MPTPDTTTPATTATPATAPVTTAITASPRPVAHPITVKDITPAPTIIHQVTIPSEQVAAILAAIDPNAPANPVARQIAVAVDRNGELIFVIHYAPAKSV